ncbi:MAG: 16S rRNA (guanine(966)-N(2))-methyltransferase RsmD [Bacteroidia bacterium]|nr:16S rRNA (guanine(966)-N(2))-methyltransferase RsmD [Bacteroidia bacterium]
MRILRGKWQGRAIPFPKGAPTRPLTEKAREALFHILSHRWQIEGSQVLDLFAGSGAVGLEFLSRGAARVAFVEQDPRAAHSLRSLLRQWGAEERGRVFQMDVMMFLATPSTAVQFIFAGPPFRYWQKKRLIQTILEGGWLQEGGCLIVEHPSYESYADHPSFWRQERYVASVLSFFRG